MIKTLSCLRIEQKQSKTPRTEKEVSHVLRRTQAGSGLRSDGLPELPSGTRVIHPSVSQPGNVAATQLLHFAGTGVGLTAHASQVS